MKRLHSLHLYSGFSVKILAGTWPFAHLVAKIWIEVRDLIVKKRDLVNFQKDA